MKPKVEIQDSSIVQTGGVFTKIKDLIETSLNHLRHVIETHGTRKSSRRRGKNISDNTRAQAVPKSQESSKERQMENAAASMADAILQGASHFLSNPESQAVWDTERRKPKPAEHSLEQLRYVYERHADSTRQEFCFSSLMACFACAAQPAAPIGKPVNGTVRFTEAERKAFRRRRNVGLLIISLINDLSKKHDRKAYNICVALAANPGNVSWRRSLLPCCAKDVTDLTKRIVRKLDDGNSSRWQDIEQRYAVDPAKMIAANNFPYDAAKRELGLCAPPLESEAAQHTEQPSHVLSEQGQRHAWRQPASSHSMVTAQPLTPNGLRSIQMPPIPIEDSPSQATIPQTAPIADYSTNILSVNPTQHPDSSYAELPPWSWPIWPGMEFDNAAVGPSLQEFEAECTNLLSMNYCNPGISDMFNCL